MVNLPSGIATKAFSDEKALAHATSQSQSNAAATAAAASGASNTESPRAELNSVSANGGSPGSGGGGGGAAAAAAAKKVVKRALKLTDSAKFLYDIVRKLLKDVSPILDNSVYPAATIELYPAVVTGAIKLFEGYLIGMASKAKDGLMKLEDHQSLSIVANAFYVADDLLPRVTREFSRQFRRPIPELEAFRNKIERLHEALGDEYCTKKAAHWIHTRLQWTSGAALKRYSLPALSDHDHAAPTQAVIDLCRQFCDLRELVIRCLNPQSLDTILSLCLEEVFRTLHNPVYWDGLALGHGGLQQLVLDLRFLVAASHGIVTQTASEACVSLIKRAIQLYAASTGQRITSAEEVLETEVWFNTMIEAAIKKTVTVGKLIAAAANPPHPPPPTQQQPAPTTATAAPAPASAPAPTPGDAARPTSGSVTATGSKPTGSGSGSIPAPPPMPSRANKPTNTAAPGAAPPPPVASTNTSSHEYAAAVAAAPPPAKEKESGGLLSGLLSFRKR